MPCKFSHSALTLYYQVHYDQDTELGSHSYREIIYDIDANTYLLLSVLVTAFNFNLLLAIRCHRNSGPSSLTNSAV